MALIGTILSKEQHAELYQYHDSLRAHASWTGRFGFYYFDELRKRFCHSFCNPADIDHMSYFAKLMCAAKCPELYLPHGTSTPSAESTTESTTKITTIAISNTTVPLNQSTTMHPSIPTIPPTNASTSNTTNTATTQTTLTTT